MIRFDNRRLHEIRLALRLSLREFAEMLGTTKQGVAGWESGQVNPQVNTLARICNVTGARVESFFREDPDP